MYKPAWRAFTACALLAAIACGDDGSGPEGSISVSAAPTSLTVPQGGSGTITVTLTRGGGFDDPVTVTVEGLPAGVTAAVSPSPLTGNTSSATVTVNVANTVAPGTYSATVRASATGVGAATVQYTLIVTAAPNYALSANPAAVTIAPGASGTSTINIQRTSFTGAVGLTLDNPPAGITGSFNPASATADQSTLTINVASTVAAGSYPLTVKGSATGPGDKTTTVTVTVPAPQSGFTISASPATVNIAAGGNANSTVTIVRTNLTSDVALSLVNPPAGITGTFTPATLSGATLTSTLAITVAGNVQAGTYPLTVRGVSGAITQNATVNVTVTAPSSSVTLAVNPTTLTIQQGASGQTTLTATRTNFSGDITPSVTGNPAGMTVTFNPTAITGTGTTSTATVNVGAGVAPGTYNLTITGAAGAAGNPTTSLAVTVTAPAGGNITWEFCNSDPVPLKFWRQSGGTWAEVAPTVVGNVTRFIFSVTGTTGGIAFTTSQTSSAIRDAFRAGGRRTTMRDVGKLARQKSLGTASRLTNQNVGELASSYFDTFVMYALASELSSNARVCDATGTNQVSKTFTLTGLGASEQGQLGYGPGSASLTPQQSSYNVMVPPGTYDWLAAFGPTPSFPDLTMNFTHYRLGRGEVAPGGTVAIDRTGATSFVTTPFSVTGGTQGSFYTFVQLLEGANGSITALPLGSPVGTTPSGNMLFLAANDRLATDMNAFGIINTELAGDIVNGRSTFHYFGPNPPASTAFPLPAAVPAFTVTQVAGAPVTTWQASGQIPADYQDATSVVEASFQGGGETTLYTISATRGWLTANNMSTSYTLAGPNLPGFQAQWAPAAPLVDAQVIMFGSNLTGSMPVAGSVINIGFRLVESP